MFKYNVKTFEEFFTTIARSNSVYIEHNVNDDPTPIYIGVVFPLVDDDKISIILCLYADNNTMSYDDFKHMIFYKEMDPSTKVKVYTIFDLLELYKSFIKEDCTLFVIDDIKKDKFIGNNN